MTYIYLQRFYIRTLYKRSYFTLWAGCQEATRESPHPGATGNGLSWHHKPQAAQGWWRCSYCNTEKASCDLLVKEHSQPAEILQGDSEERAP